jgi:hypothetical protein
LGFSPPYSLELFDIGGYAPLPPVHFSFFWLSKERKTNQKERKSAGHVRGSIPRTPSFIKDEVFQITAKLKLNDNAIKSLR